MNNYNIESDMFILGVIVMSLLATAFYFCL